MPDPRARGLDYNVSVNGTDYAWSNFEFTPNVETSAATNNMSINPFTAPVEVDFDVTISIDGSMREILGELYNMYWIPQPAVIQLRGPQGGHRMGHVLATGGPIDLPDHDIASLEVNAHADFAQMRGGSYAPQNDLGARSF